MFLYYVDYPTQFNWNQFTHELQEWQSLGMAIETNPNSVIQTVFTPSCIYRAEII